MATTNENGTGGSETTPDGASVEVRKEQAWQRTLQEFRIQHLRLLEDGRQDVIYVQMKGAFGLNSDAFHDAYMLAHQQQKPVVLRWEGSDYTIDPKVHQSWEDVLPMIPKGR
jgi:hypothetical protein